MDMLTKESNIFFNIFCYLLSENQKFSYYNDRLYWRTVYHLILQFHHTYISLYALTFDLEGNKNIEVQTLKKYRIGFLTGWNFLFQSVFLALAVFYDFLEWTNKHEGKLGKRIQYIRDIVFSGLVVPITMFVTGMFWSVYSIDRELVFPKVYDDIVPWWFNHCVHTNILIVICIETLLQPRRYPRDKKVETICVITTNVLYAVVYYSIYFLSHRWLYQVFGVMTWWQVCLFQCFIWAINYVFYRIQFPINRLIHGSVETDKDGKENSQISQLPNSELGNKNRKVGTENGNGVSENGNKVSVKEIGKTENGNKVSVKENGKTENGNKVGVNGNGKTENGNKVGVNGNGVNGDSNKEGVNGNDVEDDDRGIEFEIHNSARRNSNSPPFADRTWSLKYRSLRNQFENTNL